MSNVIKIFSIIMISCCIIGYWQLYCPNKITQVENGLLSTIQLQGVKTTVASIFDRMKFYKTSAVSIAIIDQGKIAWAKGYGTANTQTLFQAASISKPVTAMGALLLVQQGKLSLDEDVNVYLKSWKVPANECTKKEKVTLRRLLSHSAGTSFLTAPGYTMSDNVPTLLEILEGKESYVNSNSIQVTEVPGKKYCYSGGGTLIVQLLIEDVTGQPFEMWMKEHILIPFGMTSSTFDQPLSQADANRTASSHDNYRIYPEKAAAGLWTTPTDLAQFVITFCDILHGKKNDPLSVQLVKEALNVQIKRAPEDKGGVGLGFMIGTMGKDILFGHAGRNWGFDSNLIMYPELGKGWIVMINSNVAALMAEVEYSLTQAYQIPYPKPEIKMAIAYDIKLMSQCSGIYKNKDNIVTVIIRDNKLCVIDNFDTSLSEMELYYSGNDTFFTKETPYPLQFIGTGSQFDSFVLFCSDGTKMLDENNQIVEFKRVK